MTQPRPKFRGSTAQLSLPNRFDILTSGEFRVPFVRTLSDSTANRLEIDLSGLAYIDSMGIGTLIYWEDACKKNGKSMVLTGCAAPVRKLLKFAGVDGLFEFSAASC